MPVTLFQFLGMLDPALVPEECKIHLAVFNGLDDPLDLYVAGSFDPWQEGQNNQNFKRPQVVALIAMPEKDTWLFAGAYWSRGCEQLGEHRYRYDLEPNPAVAPLGGRIVVRFKRTGRQSYLVAEHWVEEMVVSELRPQKLQIVDFPGYSRTKLTKQQLDIVVEQQLPSWRGALSSVGGVYVIADRETGKLYVGSATGEEGLWSRWSTYSATGHGHNRELMDLLSDQGADHARHFQFAILEIADTHASPEDTIARESYWKELLLSRSHGYNAN